MRLNISINWNLLEITHMVLALHWVNIRNSLSFLNDLNNISPQFTLFPEDVFVKTLLYGNPIFDENDNQEIIETLIR